MKLGVFSPPPIVPEAFARQVVLVYMAFGFTEAEGEAILLSTTLLADAAWAGLISRSKAVEIGDEIGDVVRAAHLERTRV